MMVYLAQPEQQQRIEWIDGGTLALLLDRQTSNGKLTMGRFDVKRGEAPSHHICTREDEVFMLIGGTVLVWCDDQETELREGSIVYLPRDIPHSYRITYPEARFTDDLHTRRDRGDAPTRRAGPGDAASGRVRDVAGASRRGVGDPASPLLRARPAL